MNENYSTVSDLMYLAACAVNKRIPSPDRVQRMNFDEIYDLSLRHSLTATVAFALEAAGVNDSRFGQAKAKMMRKTVLLDTERKRVFQQLEAQGIWYLPLKGAVLKEDYPSFGMREMADNDILCDPTRMADVKAIMEGLGFTCVEYEHSNHDAYRKPPSIEFEMHRALFKRRETKRLTQYYADIENRLLKDHVSEYGRCFSLEDFYIYILAHEYKHYSNAGTGLRSLLDVYVFLSVYGKALRRGYLDDELKKAGIFDFEHMNRELAMRVFTTGEIDERSLRDIAYFLTSGTYGNEQQQTYNHLNDAMHGDDSASSKARHVFRLMFCDMETIETMYPFAYRHRILLPFLFIYRAFRALILHPKQIFLDLKTIKNYRTKKESNNKE